MDLKCTCLLLFSDVDCDETTTFMGVEKPERTELPVLPTQEESASEKNGNAKGTTANGKSSARCNISQCMHALLGINLACLAYSLLYSKSMGRCFAVVVITYIRNMVQMQ